MRPIDRRTDRTFNQALRCVEFRLPRHPLLVGEPLELALGARYGLIGIAAAHHLLLTCPDSEEAALVRQLKCYGTLVEEHVRYHVVDRFQHPIERGFASRVGFAARQFLNGYLPLYQGLSPIEASLSSVSAEYLAAHRNEIVAGVALFKRGRTRREFSKSLEQSHVFALAFFERRQADLDEVPEIALLGE